MYLYVCMYVCMYTHIYTPAQSVGAVEYTDCISAENKIP